MYIINVNKDSTPHGLAEAGLRVRGSLQACKWAEDDRGQNPVLCRKEGLRTHLQKARA